MYSYLISPKEAFREVIKKKNNKKLNFYLKFNVEQNGRLTFHQFEALLSKLSELSRTEQQPYSIVKDLFDLIDIRKDNVIDMKEWLHAFRVPDQKIHSLNPNQQPRFLSDSLQFPKQLTKEQQQLVKLKSLMAVSSSNSPLRLPRTSSILPRPKEEPTIVSSVNWELSMDYDRVLSLLGKNRKVIQDEFEALLRREGPSMTAEKCLAVLKKIVKGLGIDESKVNWRALLKIAEKDGFFDYKFFLAILKQRADSIMTHPKLH